MGFLGIDASNYTSSAAILSEDDGIIQDKTPLPVAEGTVGLRQSDAVFAHVRQLGPLMERVAEGYRGEIRAVGVSVSPRDEEGSYMPCFLAGKMCAQSAAAVLGVPLYEYSHQAGHIAAALYDTRSEHLFEREFLAFHISGGTTQCLLVKPGASSGEPFGITTLARSLDLHAGQLIDRVGAMLGLKFPAGPELTELALKSDKNYTAKIAFKGLDCCLSGVENQCRGLLENGGEPCDIAGFCIGAVESAVLGMTERVRSLYPGRELVYAGGVMSCSIIRENVSRRCKARFASPAFSSDNAAGIAVLCGRSYRKEQSGI